MIRGLVRLLSAGYLGYRAKRWARVRLLRALGRMLPVQRGRLVLVYHNRSGSNTLALMEHRPGDLDPDWEIRLVRLGRGESLGEQLRKLAVCARAQVIVTTHRLVAADLEDFGKPGQISVELWHGFPFKAITLMEPAMDPRTKRKVAAGWARAGRIASYSPLGCLVLNACFGTDINQYVVTGAPRNDWLFSADGRPLLERALERPLGGDRAVCFMPTFRSRGLGQVDGARREGNFLGFPDFDPAEFRAFLEREALQFILKIHPVEEAELGAWVRSQAGGRVHLLTDAMLERQALDLYQLLPGVDALVTDYSGVAFDYLLLDRPMVFTPVDLEAYRDNRNLALQPYDFWAPGPKAVTQAEFQRELARAVREPGYYRAERALVRRLLHTFPDGESCRRVWDLLGRLMRGAPA
jgi:CDP-glycerol glycerophosphotransferase (TagB/SpsB family)